MNSFHPLDKLITDNSLFLLEAIVAFVDYPYKKMLVMLIKYRELMSILNCLEDKAYISECGFDCHPGSTEDMIYDMCKFMPGDYASSIKNMQKIISMMNSMNSFNPTGSSPSSDINMSDVSKMMQLMNMINQNSSGNDDAYSKASRMYDDIYGATADNSEGYRQDNLYENKHNNTHTESYNESNDSLYDSVLNILNNET